jgi:N-methylhydantoinase A
MLFSGWKRHRACPVYRREQLVAGARIAGPAVVEEEESTTVVGPDMRASVDTYGNLVLERS